MQDRCVLLGEERWIEKLYFKERKYHSLQKKQKKYM